jgi:alpha-beta hydrolase superfamily lysophospholipase
MHTLLALLIAVTAVRAQAPKTQFVTSKDGTKIAYDVAGSGPVVILLHGGGQARKSWHRAGYVTRLAKEFTVVTVDIRGNGESDRPQPVSAYAIERIIEDIFAVADTVKAQQFSIWGFSYGANIGRYLASRSDRVTSMVYIGINFGPAVDDLFMSFVKKMPQVPVWLEALIGYPRVEPSEMKCPTLWLVGTNNEGAYASAKQYQGKLAGTKVTLEIVDGLSHPQEFELIDRLYPREIAFTRLHAR